MDDYVISYPFGLSQKGSLPNYSHALNGNRQVVRSRGRVSFDDVSVDDVLITLTRKEFYYLNYRGMVFEFLTFCEDHNKYEIRLHLHYLLHDKEGFKGLGHDFWLRYM